jgi:peptidyl-tRNA hydrolase, PTH1 family
MQNYIDILTFIDNSQLILDNQCMKLIVGLGNPGKEYELTRHNAGFQFVEFLVKKYSLNVTNKFSSLFAEMQFAGEKIIILKPQTFMNESGRAVVEAMKFYKITFDDVYIAFDDLDIKLGEFKVQKGHYPKVHNGINDIIGKTKTDQFTYIRIGVDDRSPIEKDFLSGKDYVLKKFTYNLSPIFENIILKLDFLKERNVM